MFAASSLFFAPAAARAQGHPTPASTKDVIAANPAVHTGVLANGLRYAVLSNRTPSRAVSFRLYMGVGSYDETDAERGYAHFIEHMAFNGTRHIPENRLDTMFGVQGVAFGRDQNAETSYFGTTYMLDVPQVDATKLDLAFAWLRDIADGLTLDQKAVDRERGVVLAEDDRSKGPERDWGERLQKFLAPELRTTARDPIGTHQTVAAASAANLRAFYDKWYRPDQAILVIAGDLPAAELEQRVRASFADWTARTPAPQHLRPTEPNLSRGFDVFTATEPNLPSTVSYCLTRKDDERGADSVARTRLLLDRAVWRAVLNERLRALAETDDPPFAKAEVTTRTSEREALYNCVDLYPLKDDWRRGFEAALGEVRRLEAHGANQEETGRALEGIRASYRAAAEAEATQSSSSAVTSMLVAAVRGEVIATARERFRVLDRAGATLDEKTVSEAFRRDWRGAGPFLMVTTPKAVSLADGRTAWRQAMARPAPAAAEKARALAWAYEDFGAAGAVARRQEIADPGFQRITFQNGVVLNFKRLTASHDKVKVKVRFGAGRREIPKQDWFAAELGSVLFAETGLGKHDAESMRRLFSNHGWEARLSILDDAFVLGGDTNPTDLGLEMQILGAFLSDPGFRRSADAKLPTAMESMLRQNRASPEYAMSQALNLAVAADGAYVAPSRERMLAIDSRTFERLFKPALTTAPLEVTIVGDTTEDRAIDAVARTLAALPARKAQSRANPDTWFLRFPTTAPPVIRTTYESKTEKAVISLTWPLYVAEPKRRREEYALNLLANVMDDAIRHKVREEMGKSYAPSVGMSSPDAADQGQIAALIETDAADAEAVARAARDTAREIADHGVGHEAFEAARKPVIDSAQTRLEDLDWWMGGLDGSAGNPEILREFVDWGPDMNSVTLADVNRSAKLWLAQTPIVVIATPARAVQAAAAVPQRAAQ